MLSVRVSASSLDALWSSFDELANYPGQIPQRTAALEQAGATVEQFSFMDAQIRDLRRTSVMEAGTLVAQVNDLATEVAALNDAIRPLLLTGAGPNDLLDQRDIALGKLSDLVGASFNERNDGTVERG